MKWTAGWSEVTNNLGEPKGGMNLANKPLDLSGPQHLHRTQGR